MKKQYVKPDCAVFKLNYPIVLAPISDPLCGTEGTDDIDLDLLLL